MKKLVRPFNRNVQCDIHTCKNTAEYSIGLEGFSALYVNVCRDCLTSIVKEGISLLKPQQAETETAVKTEPVKETEYYVCKECGEKFVKPDHLSEYRSHVASHRKGLKSAETQLKDFEKNLKVKAPTVTEVLKASAKK